MVVLHSDVRLNMKLVWFRLQKTPQKTETENVEKNTFFFFIPKKKLKVMADNTGYTSSV